MHFEIHPFRFENQPLTRTMADRKIKGFRPNTSLIEVVKRVS